MALRRSDLVGVAVPPDRALPQQPVRRAPRPDQQQGRPPREADEHHRRGQPGEELDQPAGDEVDGDAEGRPGDAQVEVAGHGQVVGEVGPLQVGDPGRTVARDHQPVVEPCRGTAAEIGPDGLMAGRHDLEHDEGDTDEGQRAGQGAMGLHGAHDGPGADGEHRRQHAAQDEEQPPDGGQRRRGAVQRAEELPLLALAHRGAAGWLGGTITLSSSESVQVRRQRRARGRADVVSPVVADAPG